MFSKGRAWMQASLDKPFRERITAAGQGTHAQLGPGQAMVVRWASSHNNTFTFAVVAATDQEWFYHKDYYAFLDDYVSSARPSIYSYDVPVYIFIAQCLMTPMLKLVSLGRCCIKYARSIPPITSFMRRHWKDRLCSRRRQ